MDQLKDINFHLKNYGLKPGLRYKIINEKATVSLLLNEQQLNKIADLKTTSDSPKKTSSEQEEKKSTFKKYPQFELSDARKVQQFLMATRQGQMLKAKIDQLKKEGRAKGLQKQKQEQEQNMQVLKKVEEEKEKFDRAMNKKYGIRPKLDYLVEISSIAIYLILSQEDIHLLANQNRARIENAFKTSLNKKK